MKLYEGGFHDLLNDIDKKLVMRNIIDWVNARVAATVGNQARTQAASL
ncbi:MAG TPA: hypothetical protein VN957_07075 [Chthoniobacterales bacterium]|nr:hypothetical protein [Chthoniobacterales bacterium]